MKVSWPLNDLWLFNIKVEKYILSTFACSKINNVWHRSRVKHHQGVCQKEWRALDNTSSFIVSKSWVKDVQSGVSVKNGVEAKKDDWDLIWTTSCMVRSGRVMRGHFDLKTYMQHSTCHTEFTYQSSCQSGHRARSKDCRYTYRLRAFNHFRYLSAHRNRHLEKY